MKCCICNGEIRAVGTWTKGNNAEPVKAGRCCDHCDQTVVIPARIAGLTQGSIRSSATKPKKHSILCECSPKCRERKRKFEKALSKGIQKATKRKELRA